MYLLTGRINQDCLENLSSQVRCKGEHRFNPSAREFAFAYRSLTTSMLINPIPSANCIDDPDDLLVSLSDLSKTSTNEARDLKRRNEERGQGEIPAKQARHSETEPLVVDVIEERGQGEIPAKQARHSETEPLVVDVIEERGQGEIPAKQARQSETEPLVVDVIEERGQGEIPAKQARQSETEPLVVDVIDDFQLSVTVVNVVTYVAGYIIRKIQLQTKCLEYLGKLSDTSLVVPESKLLIHFKAYQHNETSASGSLYTPSENFTNFLMRVEKVFQRNRCMCQKGVLSTLMDSVQDTVPSTVLKLCPKHKGCEFTKSITTLYVRCRIHYYFTF